MTPAEIIKKYVEIRDWIEADTKANDARQKPYVDGLTTLEGMMMEHLNKNELDNVKSEFGTAFKKQGTRVRVADRGAFNEFVLTQPDPLAFFTNAVAKEKIVEYITENNCAPAGVDVSYITTVQFNRPRGG